VFNLVMVTVPGLVIWWALFLLFTCPGLGCVDESAASPANVRRAFWVRACSTALGYVIVLLGCLAIFSVETHINDYWRPLASGRLKGYVISAVLMVFVYFNPLIAWGQPNPDATSCHIGDLIGLGQWTIEKQRFQAVCEEALYKMSQEAQSGLE